MLRSTWKNTWLVEDCPCILWGLVLRSINLASIIPSPSMLLTSTGIGELLWFCWFSFVWKFGDWFWSLLTPFWTTCWSPGSVKWPGLSPGNYRRISKREVLISVYKPDKKKLNQKSPVQRHKPELSAWIGDTSCGFFYHLHVQSYRIAGKGSYHLPHSKRRLHTCFQREA